MKKNVLALSISAAVCSLGMISTAHAITDLGVAGSVGSATQMKVNSDGVGHNIIVPYFTAQGANATLINLVNTSSVGKAVKVRFRGAANSDDILDFQVFMSPYDVWSANVSKSASGEAQIVTNDVSCTKPQLKPGVPQKFLTARLDSTLTGDALANGTREGYLEIFNMADIGPGTALATAITHVAGKAPCSAAALNALDTDTSAAVLLAAGLRLPTTGLTADWLIVNLASAAAYGGRGVAIQAINAVGTQNVGPVGTGNLVYWPQNSTLVSGETRGWTADPLLATGGAIKALNQDLPDMSTPYTNMVATGDAAVTGPFNSSAVYNVATDAWAASTQAAKLTESLAATSVSNLFLTDSATLNIGAATDWVFSMPTRRYNVSLSYASGAAVFTDFSRTINGTVGTSGYQNYFDSSNTTVVKRQVCAEGISNTFFDREEQSDSAGVSFSPNTSPVLCGEVSVWAINKTAPTVSSVLDASVALAGPTSPYGEGWLSVATPGKIGVSGAPIGLPVIGASFTKASSDATKNFGVNADHRVTRIIGYAY